MMASRSEIARFNMVEQQIRPWEVINPRVLTLMETLPREAFVPEEYADLAYADIEIPIGQGQRMMFPRVEARLLQALDPQPGERALEVGTGSGYLTACLAHLAQEVVSVDLHPEFIESATAKLAQQNIKNVALLSADALAAPADDASYDVIAVTGSLPTRAQADIFCRQLAPGGRLFVVIGSAPVMECLLITRDHANNLKEEPLFETELSPLEHAITPVAFEF
ncbi:MAG: protein-L-isoaspartate O-methyltransferase [Candidatus Thiodiazotropha sp.]